MLFLRREKDRNMVAQTDPAFALDKGGETALALGCCRVGHALARMVALDDLRGKFAGRVFQIDDDGAPVRELQPRTRWQQRKARYAREHEIGTDPFGLNTGVDAHAVGCLCHFFDAEHGQLALVLERRPLGVNVSEPGTGLSLIHI